MPFRANTSLSVSELDFDTLAQNIRDYIKSKPEFLDYNFEGSTVSLLIDMLAYNTYQNAFYMNQIANESFLDTAQIRENAVSLAKHIGYTPRSARSARATITISFEPYDDPGTIIIPKGTRFKSTLNNVDYTFSTLQELSVSSEMGMYTKTIQIYEGIPSTQRFQYDSATPFYEILAPEVNTETLEVQVVSVGGPQTTTFAMADDITEIDEKSQIYFLQEGIDGKYEISFGDGIIGRPPNQGDQIVIRYLACNGEEANEVSSFTNISYSGYNPNDPSVKYLPSAIVLVERGNGGQDRETLNAIKFNAPKSYEAQGRAVVPEDYKTFLINNYSYIQSVNVWGGEEHEPPVYGRVILSIKPLNGYALPESRKQSIIADLKKRNVMSIEPIIIDPIFVYINPDITVRYDSTRTTESPETIYNKIEAAVRKYEEDKLSIFGNNFYYSQFLETVSKADSSVLSTELSTLLEKRFSPVLQTTLTYRLRFDSPVRHPYSGYLGAVNSTGFTLANNSNVQYLDDDGIGNIRTYYLNPQGIKVYTNATSGTINYETGDIVLDALRIVSFEGDEIRLFLEPRSSDYVAQRNQIVLLSHPRLSVVNIRTNQTTVAGVLDVFGNLSPIYNSYIEAPVTL